MSFPNTKRLFILGSLLLLAHFAPATGFALLRGSPCSTLEKTPGWEAAYDYHQKCKNYHQYFFKPKVDLAMAKKLSEWYQKTVFQIYDENPEYRKSNVTEAQVFAKEMSGDGDFDCTGLEPSCNRKFTPREIINHLGVMHPEWEPKRLIQQARRVSLALDRIEDANILYYVANNILTTIQLNAGQLSGTVIRYFTNQKNSEAEALCSIKEKMLEFGVALTQNLIFFGWNFMGQSLQGITKIVFQAAVNIVVATTDAIKAGTEIGINNAQVHAADAWSAANMNGTGEVQLENPWSVGLCGDVGGNFDPMNWENQVTLEEFIQNIFRGMRAGVQQASRAVMMGQWAGETPKNKSLIANYFAKPDPFLLSERLKQDLPGFEEQLTTYFTQSMESSAMVRSKCYVKCISTPDKRKVEKCNPKDWWNRDSRFCPAEDDHAACQLECITVQDKSNHLRKPPGIEKARKLHAIGQKEIAEASYQNWIRKGSNQYEDPRGLVSNGILGLDAILNSGVRPYSLPVSISEYGSLAEFDDTIEVQPGREDLNRQFPCISGDWTASGTGEFMKRLEFDPKGKDFVSLMARELIEEICPRNLQALPPATHYFATCALGIQYPRQEFVLKPGDDYYYRIKNGASAHCPALVKEARENNMTEGEGNYHFCKESPLFTEVAKAELNQGGLVLSPTEKAPWLGQSHRWRCQHWLKLYEKEWKEAGVKSSADVRRLEDAGRRFPMKAKP